jgi:hypothetical protein
VDIDPDITFVFTAIMGCALFKQTARWIYHRNHKNKLDGLFKNIVLACWLLAGLMFSIISKT